MIQENMILERWQRLTGQEATLDGTGRPFSIVAQERQGATDEVRG